MMMAPVGLIWNVRGMSIATPATGPTPGRTPISVPSIDPRKANRRLCGVRATEKPMSRL